MSENDKIRLAGELYLEQQRLADECRTAQAKVQQTAEKHRQFAKLLDSTVDSSVLNPPPAEYVQGRETGLDFSQAVEAVREYQAKMARLKEVQRLLENVRP